MKKVLSLVIALVLTLAAVSALAAAPSKTNPDLVKVISEYFELSDKTYDIKEYPVIIKLQFGTDYAGKEVILLGGARDENGEPADWMSQVSVGNDDGTIDLVLQKEDVEWLAGRDFMVLVLE